MDPSAWGWGRRLATVVTVLWIALVYFAVGKDEKIVFFLVGILPPALLWGVAWIWSGYRSQHPKIAKARPASSRNNPVEPSPSSPILSRACVDQNAAAPAARVWFRDFGYYALRWTIIVGVLTALTPVYDIPGDAPSSTFWQIKLQQLLLGLGWGFLASFRFIVCPSRRSKTAKTTSSPIRSVIARTGEYPSIHNLTINWVLV